MFLQDIRSQRPFTQLRWVLCQGLKTVFLFSRNGISRHLLVFRGSIAKLEFSSIANAPGIRSYGEKPSGGEREWKLKKHLNSREGGRREERQEKTWREISENANKTENQPIYTQIIQDSQ